MTPLAFPWISRQTLLDPSGLALELDVTTHDEQVVIQVKHSAWSLMHVALLDGTPVSTVKVTPQGATRISYSPAGAELALPQRTLFAEGAGLWDRDTLDARLAGIAWRKGKQLRFLTVDPADGKVYPMLALGIGPSRCANQPCETVKLMLDGWRGPFGPVVQLRYGKDGRYLGRISRGEELYAPHRAFAPANVVAGQQYRPAT